MSNNNKVYGSAEVAEQLEISPAGLRMFLSRYPQYRPKGRISGNDLLWTAAEVAAVAKARSAKRGRQKK